MKRTLALLVSLALVAGLASAAPSLYGSNGLFRTISAKNAGPMNFGIGAYVYGWKWDNDSTAATPYKTGAMDLTIVPNGYFSINDMIELSLATNYLMPSRYDEAGGIKTTVNPSGLGYSRVGAKFSLKAGETTTLGAYLGYDIGATLADTFLKAGETTTLGAYLGYDIGATLADTFKQGTGYKYNGGIDGRLLAGFNFGQANLDLNAGVYYDMDQIPDYATADTTDSKGVYPNMSIPLGMGFSYDMGLITPYVELQALYVMDTIKYPKTGSATETVNRGIMDNPAWIGAGLRFYVANGLNITLGGEYNLQADSSANSPYFDDDEHWHAVFGLHYAPKKVAEKVPATGIIAGKVTDKAGKGLAAVVTAAGLSANTDPATGAYQIAGIPVSATPVEVKADAKGYIAKSSSIVVTKKHKKVPAVQDFVLELKPIPASDVTGIITDYKDGKPLANATLTFKGPKTVTAKTDAAGKYTAKLEEGNYQVNVAAEGYKPFTFNVTAKGGMPVKQDASLVKVAEKFAFSNVYFASGKATITPNAEAALEQIYKILKEHPELKVEIGGHTDNLGRKAANIKLSQARAEAVVQWLIAKGIPASQMTAKGYGPNEPVDTNKTKAGREKNRRIEVKVIE